MTVRLDHCTMELDPVIWQRIERRATNRLNGSQWHELLSILDRQGTITTTEAGQRLGLSRGSVRTMLEILVAMKVLRVEALPAHANAYLLNREDLSVLFA
jgi:response regulator of citrate/malate metabolism